MSILHVFDIDDTLLKTTARVGIKNEQGEIVEVITPGAFNNRALKPGESYDFTEFKSADKFFHESTTIPNMLLTFQRVAGKVRNNLVPGSRVILNTARGDFDNLEKFFATFKKHGIEIADEDVKLAGDVPGNLSTAENKLVIIREYIEREDFRSVYMYDDNEKNLAHFLGLGSDYPNINFRAYCISDSGAMREFRKP